MECDGEHCKDRKTYVVYVGEDGKKLCPKCHDREGTGHSGEGGNDESKC